MATTFYGIKAVLFDLDNTLFNHNRAQAESLAETYEQYKSVFDGTPFESFYQTYIRNNEIFWAKLEAGEISRWECRYFRFFQSLKDCSLDDSHAGEMTSTYFSIYVNIHYPVDGMYDTLRGLRRKKYRLGIITNGFVDIQENKIDCLGMRRYFDVIVMSDQVGVMKPHPDIFHTALEKIRYAADKCVFVGDSFETDVMGAARAGLKPLWYNPAKKPPPVKQPTSFGSIANLTELLKIL